MVITIPIVKENMTSKVEKSHLFIMGNERSGTSLLRAMLGSHPEISIPPNDCNLLRFYDKRQEYGNLSEKENRIKAFYDIRQNAEKLEQWSLDWQKLENDVATNCLDMKDIYRAVLENFWNKSDGKIRALKRPGYESRVVLLREIFPDSMFIGLIRDVRAVAASKKYHYGFDPRWEKAITKHTMGVSLSWEKSVNKLRELESELPKNALIINYERLVNYPEETLKKICEFLNVQYTENMLKFDARFGYKTNTSFDKKEVNTLIYKDSICRYKEKLSSLDINLIEKIAGKTLVKEGYKLLHPRMSLREKIYFRLNLFGCKIFNMVSNRNFTFI